MKITKNLLTLLFLTFNFVANAQLYPVQVSANFVPPHNVTLSSYTTTSTNKINLRLNLTDINENNLQVRLKMKISGRGLNIQSRDFIIGATPIFLNGGQLLDLTSFDLRPYFQLNNLVGITPQQYNRPLPDGFYKICFEVYTVNTPIPQLVSNPNMGCTFVNLIINDPPILNLPQRGEQIVLKDPVNIIFQWTPRHLNATNVSYEFEIREIWDNNIDPQAGFLASPPLYSETTPATTFLYNNFKPALLPDKTYAWRVRAISTNGISENSVFRNNGYSEIFYIKTTQNCDAPIYALSEAISKSTVKITWQGKPEHNKYHVQYKKTGVADAEWFEVFTYNEQAQISNLEAGVTYDFRVGGTCNSLTQFEQSYTYTNVNQFTMPTEEETVNYNCGVLPDIQIDNQDPLQNIGVNETFTAGDFPVTVKEVQGSNGKFTGKGFIVVPYLAETKIAVAFEGITINTKYQLIDGIVKTTYDPTWGGISNLSDAVNNLLNILNDYDGSEEDQNNLQDAINTLNGQLDGIEGNNDISDDVKEQLSTLQDSLNNNVDELTNEEENPTDESKNDVVSDAQQIKEITDSLASQQNTGGAITSVSSDPYFDGVIKGASTSGTVLNQTQVSTIDAPQQIQSLEIPIANNGITYKEAEVGNFKVIVSNSDITEEDLNTLKQNIETVDGIGVWLHYNTSSNEMKYKVNFSNNYFSSPQNKEVYKNVIKRIIEQSEPTDNWGGLVIQSIQGGNKLINEFIQNPQSSINLLYDDLGLSEIEIIDLIFKFMYECWGSYNIQKGIVPKCLWDNNTFPTAAYGAGIIDGAWETVVGVVDIGTFLMAWDIRNPYYFSNDAFQIRQQTMQFFELVGALYEGEGTIRDDTWNTIETEFNKYVDTTLDLTPQARYNQGKLIFDVGSLFFGVGEVKAFITTGKLTSKTVQILTKIPTNISKLLVALSGKIKKLQNNVLAYVLSANTYIEIARFTDDGIIIAKKWIDEPIEIVKTIDEVAYKKADDIAEATGEIAVVKNANGEYGLGLVDEVVEGASNLITKINQLIAKVHFTPFHNKLVDFANATTNTTTKANRLARYETPDKLKNTLISLLENPQANNIKPLIEVIDDIDKFMLDYKDIDGAMEYFDELTQSVQKIKGGAFGLEILNNLPPSLAGKTIVAFEAGIDDLSNCRFDLKFREGAVSIFVETKNYASATGFTSSFLNQFKRYISSISDLSEMKYFFRGNAGVTKANRVSKFKTMIKNNAKEIFESKPNLFTQLKMENGDNIFDWEDLKALVESSTLPDNHELFNFIEIYP